jgi:hypothetical protein
MIQKLQSKNCNSCAGQIPKHASKCQHCGSFQNWRRHLDFGNAFLALLVALVSVVGFTIPIVQKALTPNDSIVSVRFIDRTDVSFPLIVTNDGDRPAVFEEDVGIRLYFVNKQGKKSDHVLMLTLNDVNGSRDSLIIPAKSNKIFYFFVSPSQPIGDFFPKMEKDWDRMHGCLLNIKKCTLSGSFINFQGSKEQYEITVFDAKKPPKKNYGNDIMWKIFNAIGISVKVPNIDDLQKQNPKPP